MGFGEDWADLSDEQIMNYIAPLPGPYENVARSHATAGHVEMTRRLTVALREFQAASDRASRWLIRLTILLVVLTAVIVWLTYELSQHPGA
jgi:hypothetical protein